MKGKYRLDIGHDRIISYKHLGNEISEAEAKRNVFRSFRTLIQSVINEPKTDSPLLFLHSSNKKPEISEEEISSIIGELKNNEDSIYALTEMAKDNMAKGDFVKAEQLWEKLCSKTENEKYYIQQRALCRYKSEVPSHKER